MEEEEVQLEDIEEDVQLEDIEEAASATATVEEPVSQEIV